MHIHKLIDLRLCRFAHVVGKYSREEEAWQQSRLQQYQQAERPIF